MPGRPSELQYVETPLLEQLKSLGWSVKVLNDAVGGVNVLVSDDFSEVDPSIVQGEMILRGDQALTFIRARKDVGTQLNVSRMERQQVYMKSFFNA